MKLLSNYNVVKQLVEKHLEVWDVSRIAINVGIHVQALDDLGLLDIAMDLIGYPPAENFDRGPWEDKATEISKKEVEQFVKTLFRDYDKLILKRPDLFVKSK